MAYYPDELIEEVRSRNDIVDVVSSYVSLKKQGSRYFGLCPFHSEKTPSFSVSREKQMYYCFGCHAGGNVFTFVMQYEHVSFPEAMEILAQRAGVSLPEREMTAGERRKEDRRARILEANREAAKYYYRLLKSGRGETAREYFRKRKLTDETIAHFGLGYSDKTGSDVYRYLKKKGYDDEILKASGLVTIDEKRGGRDKFWNRVMFPIMDANSRVIGFGGRVMGDGKPKYLNSPETEVFDKSRNLYALNFARSSRRPGFILCEGYMDVIALHQAGFDNALASLGTSLTSGQAAVLKRYRKEIWLCYDSDEAGQNASVRAIPILKNAGLRVKVIHMDPYKDSDEFIKAEGAESFQKRIDGAENSFLFEIHRMEKSYDMRDPESNAEFFRETAKRLAGFPEEIERENYLRAITAEYHVEPGQLRSLVKSYAARGITSSWEREEAAPVRGEYRNREQKKQENISKPQRELLTWLIEEPSLYGAVSRYVGPEDFTEPLYREAAGRLYQQLAAGTVNPAQIISGFPDEEQQKEAASLFQTPPELPEGKEKKERALTELVLRVKESGLDVQEAQAAPGDLAETQRIIGERKKLQKLKKDRIRLDG